MTTTTIIERLQALPTTAISDATGGHTNVAARAIDFHIFALGTTVAAGNKNGGGAVPSYKQGIISLVI